MKILLTGSAGFLGFHTAGALLDAGHEVVGIDNFNDYYSVQLKRDRHGLLEKRSGYIGVDGDIRDRELLGSLFAEHRFELVCHLAAQVGVRYSLTHPFAYEQSNVEGFLALLEACRAGRPRRMIYASSSSVYGGNTRLPFRESDPVDNPISLYAATKKSNELMAHVYSHLYGIQTIGLRLFTVYGPWGRPDMAVWLFTEAMLRGETIKVFNHGRMRRDFTYVDDAVNGITAALFVERLNRCDLFNIGSHQSVKLMDMIRVMADSLGVKPQMDLQPLQPGDMNETYADIGRAIEILKFSPKVKITEGIPKFTAWYRGYGGAEKA